MVQIITNSNGGGGVGLYKYKGSVDYYEDLPSSGMKIGDVYNVVNAHTTAPIFPAGSNVAWTGTEWDVLGGNFDLDDYQKKLVEGDGIDLDQDTNEISVESAVINGAAAGATALQPNDNVSELINDAGYLVSSDLKQSDWGQADSSAIDYIKNKPTIGNATLTIQRNGTNVNTFTANATSNVTANISVPTKTSDITNNSGFIDKDVNNLTNYTLTTSLASVATSGSYNDLSNKPSIPTKTSDLNNDSGFIDKDVNNLTNYTLSSNLASVATSGSYNDLSNKPTIGTANLTVQKNGTTVATFGANATSGVTANITVPTKVTDLTDGGDYVKSASLATVATTGDYDDLIDKPTIPGVIDDLTSTSTTDALSAAQGKVLKDALDNISGLGKFLSLWNSATGLPISFPLSTPYTYTAGDWFMIETAGTTNYKPSGSSYTGAASTAVESGAVKQGDVYIYDGTNWLFQDNNEPQVSFSEIAGQPTDNSNLATALNAKQDNLTAGENIKISSNVISANNVFIITEDDVTVSTTQEYGVAPYNTSYYYTNIDISASAGIEWREGAIYTFVVNTEMVVASSYRNVRVKIGTGTYIPVMGTTAAISGSSYFTKANIRQFQYSTKYEAGGALHLFTDSNTTYSAMSVSEGKTATATSVRGMRSDYLKQIIKYHSVDDTAYASSWDGVTDTAPSKNAVYDKIQSVVSSIPTVNNATLTIQKNGTNVQTFTANQSTNATANISVPTDTSDLTNNAGFITSSAVKDGTLTIQKNGNTIDTFSANSASNVSVNITVPTAVTDLSDASNYQTVGNLVTDLTNADDTHYPSAKAVSDALSGAGAGDMLKSVYDPNNVAANAFDYNNFINTPSLAAVATSGDYSDLSNTPTLATVATSGSYNDLSNKPTIPAAQIQSDWTQADNTKKDYIKNKPSLATVATTGAYSDLSGTPTLATVATSGSYNDLSNKPTIPTVNDATLTIQKNGTTVKTFTANASSNVTANISVPTKTSEISNDSGYITKSVNNLDNYTLSSSLATVATTGSYSDLSNKPTIPTDTSDLTNGAGFITGVTSGDVTAALGYTPQEQHTTLSLTLTSAGWSSNTQTVTATGVTASNTVVISPAPSSFADYTSAVIYCSAQASNSLTFTCTNEPTSNITVNVLILD